MATFMSSTQGWVKVSMMLCACLSYNAFVEGFSSFCSSCSLAGMCALHASAPSTDSNDTVPSSEFRAVDRWTRTATDGFVGNVFGTPRTLTWGIVDDGTTITGSREGTSPSDLINRMDGLYGAGPGGSDLTQRPWFVHFDTAFERWEELSGLTFNYEPNDTGVAINGTTRRGVLGSLADHRIGGHRIDGNGSVLAYNYFPDHADMVIDTDDNFYNSTSNNSIRLQNILMHEIGHGLGFSHVESSNSRQLMEPFISTSFRGPQFDDILAVQRNYGDVFEKNGGNDSALTATPLGLVGRNSSSISLGVDGADPDAISMSQTDFVSIDGSSDTDYYHFTVSQPSLADFTLTGVGQTYNEGPQDGTQTTFDTSDLNFLEFDLFQDQTGSTLLAEGVPTLIPNGRNDPVRTNEETILGLTLLPGIDYYLRINGTVDNIQLYQLDLSLTSVTIPEPSAMMLLTLATGMAQIIRRRVG